MRTNRLFKNLLSEILPQVLILLLSVVKSKVFLDYLGEDVVGLNQLFSQIIAYLSLVEGGLGQAVVYRLYKPVVNNDWNQITKIQNGTRKIFSIILLMLVPLSITVGLIIPFLIKDNHFDAIYILFNFILYVISEFILYTTVFERSIYIATEKAYKSNLIIKVSLLIRKILEIIIAVTCRNLTIIFIVFIILSAIENILIRKLAQKDFNKIDKNQKEKDTSLIRDIKDLIVHKIAGIVSSNVDIILISSFIGLGKVVIYTTYSMFVSSITSLLNKISSAFLGSVGNVIEERKENSYNTFKEYNGFIFFIAMCIVPTFEFIINSFINIFYAGKLETTIPIAIMFSIILLYNIIRLPLTTYTEGAGLFKKTKICPIIESIVNLVLSLILVRKYEIIGCLFATIISLIVSEYIIKPKIIYREIFKVNEKEYYKMNFEYFIAIIIQLVITTVIQLGIEITGYVNLILYFAMYSILNFIFTCIMFKYVYKQNFLELRIKQLFSKTK